ncbi:MAG: flavodoxin domain-containing protein [Anaerolineae bacterium]
MQIRVAEEVYWVGTIDWNARNFHGYTYATPRGTTYNAYLVRDEKIALVDTVASQFAGEMLGRIRELVDPERIDYIIANHGEIDHSGAIPEVMKLAPQARLVCSRRGVESLGRYIPGDWDFMVVGTGDEISLGRKTLTFIEAPMLHWPDSMFTYIKEEALLLPNDAFGQHLATSQRFADEVNEWVVFDEAARYYANILWPFSPLVLKKIEEVQKMGVEISTVAPSHGVIWRNNPGKIIGAYTRWAKGEARQKVLVVYETMWGSTEKIARALVEGVASEGVETGLYGLPMADRSEVIKELLEAKGILVGSSTHNQRMLLNMAAFLEDLKGLRPTGKIGAAFGSYGWAAKAVQQMEEDLQEAGIDVVEAGLSFKFAPHNEEIKRAFEFGKAFARRVKAAI